MFRALAACVATTLLLQSGQATLTVTVVPDQCTKATGMELTRTSRQLIAHRDDQPQESFGFGIPALGGGMIYVYFTRMDQEPVGSECRWSFSDLPDGDYVAMLVRPDGTGGSEQGTVSATGSETIEIPAPSVTVSGVITLKGKPQPGATITISDASRPSLTVTGDPDGHYTAVLDRPSTYTIAVRAPSVGAFGYRTPALHNGANQLDFVLHPTK